MAVGCYVRQNADGSVYYPDTLPKPRTGFLIYNCAFTPIYFAVGCYFSPELYCFIFLVLVSLLTCLVNDIINKVKQILQEKEHLTSRYENSYKKLITDAMPPQCIFFILLLNIGALCYVYNKTSSSLSYNLVCIFCTIMITFDFHRIINLVRCPLDESLLIGALNGMDYGSGMAASFFHGYLKLVLPRNGDRSFEELIFEYEATQHVTIRKKKLYILIPISGKCPSTLDDTELGIEESTPLPEKVYSVAGVKDRIYKNSVYKILQENVNEKVYVCLEYATPVKTFHDVFTSSSQFSAMYKRHCKEINTQFYVTLKLLLEENPECNKMCELIYYDDKLPCGGYRKDIGRIVLERINDK